MAIVVNLFGTCGAGKSTGAAYVFSKLKMQGVNCEFVTEFAKDLTWEKNNVALNNQLYVTGNQIYRLDRVKDKVDVIITDSPIILGSLYNKDLSDHYNKLIVEIFNKYDNFNFFINRVKKFNPIGRNETEEESDEKAVQLKRFLLENIIWYCEVNGDNTGYDTIVDSIMEYIKVNK